MLVSGYLALLLTLPLAGWLLAHRRLSPPPITVRIVADVSEFEAAVQRLRSALAGPDGGPYV